MVLNESTLVDSGKAHSFDSFIEPRWLNADANSKYQPQQDDVEQLADPESGKGMLSGDVKNVFRWDVVKQFWGGSTILPQRKNKLKYAPTIPPAEELKVGLRRMTSFRSLGRYPT
jgi:hypothetical protein